MNLLSDAHAPPSDAAGRTCPLRYRYGAARLAELEAWPAEILYVVGGLYGNPWALERILAMAALDGGAVTLCFNGDFNWFNVDPDGFDAINARVLEHDALQGNVEAELYTDGDAAGCGCAYPETVDQASVDRSNRIHQRLKRTASAFPDTLRRLEALPMARRYAIGGASVGVVHGDADSLAGWRFDPPALDDPANRAWIEESFARAGVSVFASTHTCSAGLRRFDGCGAGGAVGVVVNNGAAGMPNFQGDAAGGLITRIGLSASPHPVAYGARCGALHIDALPVDYDRAAWIDDFLANWPEGSDAYRSYFTRIVSGTDLPVARAAGR